MEYLSLHALLPSWNMQWLQLLVIDQADAMAVDAVPAARPLAPASASAVGPYLEFARPRPSTLILLMQCRCCRRAAGNDIESTGAITQMFDTISYSKGASVLRMLQAQLDGSGGLGGTQTWRNPLTLGGARARRP